MTPPTPPPGTPREPQPVRLMKSELTGRKYAVTAYTKPDDPTEKPRVIEMFDVTDDYRLLFNAEHAERVALGSPLAQAAGLTADETALRAAVDAASVVHSDTIDAPVDDVPDARAGGT